MFGQQGLTDWKIQRVSAVFLGAATIACLVYFLTQGANYLAWKGVVSLCWVKAASVGVVLSLVSHAWIGLWTIATDYIKSSTLRFCMLSTIAFVLLGYMVWAIQIVWSV